MELVFLGTGSAWCIPEHSCTCAICAELTKCGEQRTRTSFLVRGPEAVLVDCGPDLRLQMMANQLERPDLILVTHEHGDHFLGMDDLLAFRRSLPSSEWIPIPVYATEKAWEAIEVRFGYLMGTLIERRIAEPGIPLQGTKMRITPFKTFHGPTAQGSVGYVLEDGAGERGGVKIVYTSDFMRVEDEPEILFNPDILIIQSHWLNEPLENRPHHLSFQRAIEYIRHWKPLKTTYLVHMSDGDQVPGDPCNNFLKKYAPLSPLAEPSSGRPYPVPRCHGEWQDVVDRVRRDYDLPCPLVVPFDGMRVQGL
jgi:phosphoribosyl 1,2-cyclic phosphate phosphodiesterase